MAIHGKFSAWISNTRSTLVERSERLSIIRATKDPTGRRLKQFSPEPTTLQFRDMLRLTRSVWDCGNQFQLMNLILRPLTVVIITRRLRLDNGLNTSQVSFILTIQPNRASNSVSNNSICWFQPLYKISSGAIKFTANKTKESLIGKISPTKLLSNSMIPILLLLLLNCYVSWLTRSILIRKLLGTLFMTPFHTPIILCYLRPLKNGVFIFWKDFYQDIWNSFTSLTTFGSPELPKSTQEMLIKWTFFLLLNKVTLKKSEWPTFVSLVHTKSMVWLIFILNCLNKTFSETSTKYSLISSSTKLTELPQEDGFCVRTPD